MVYCRETRPLQANLCPTGNICIATFIPTSFYCQIPRIVMVQWNLVQVAFSIVWLNILFKVVHSCNRENGPLHWQFTTTGERNDPAERGRRTSIDVVTLFTKTPIKETREAIKKHVKSLERDQRDETRRKALNRRSLLNEITCWSCWYLSSKQQRRMMGVANAANLWTCTRRT